MSLFEVNPFIFIPRVSLLASPWRWRVDGGQPSPGSCGEDRKETVLNSVPITSEGTGKERDKQDDMPWEGPAGG